MDIKQLRYFARIVELESITAAAQALFVAQPSLSQHVANLESELGVKLLVRGAHGTKPTPAGEILYQYAKTILRTVQEASVAVKQQSRDPAGHVSLGLPTGISRIVAVDLLALITKSHRHISLEVVEASSADLAEQVARQKLDLTVAVDVQDSPKFDIYPLLTEELLLVGPASAVPPNPVALERVAELPLILPSFPNSVRVKMEQACAERGLRYTVVAEASAAAVMAGVARAAVAWTIVPWTAIKGEAANSLHCLEIDEHPLSRTLSLCVSKAAASNSACAVVKDALVGLVDEKLARGEWLYAKRLASR